MLQPKQGAEIMTTLTSVIAKENRELTEGELDQIAGGVTPSIPIPTPRPSFAYSADNAGTEHRATLF